MQKPKELNLKPGGRNPIVCIRGREFMANDQLYPLAITGLMIVNRKYLVQPVNGFCIANSIGLSVILCQGHYQTCYANDDSLNVQE